METFPVLLAICAGNSPVPGEFPTQRPVTRSFDVFFDLHLNKRLSKQWWGWWFETLTRPLWRHRNDYIKVLSASLTALRFHSTAHLQFHTLPDPVFVRDWRVKFLFNDFLNSPWFSSQRADGYVGVGWLSPLRYLVLTPFILPCVSSVLLSFFLSISKTVRASINDPGPFYVQGVWMNNCTHHKMWDEITYSISNFNGTVKVWEWIDISSQHFTVHVNHMIRLLVHAESKVNAGNKW